MTTTTDPCPVCGTPAADPLPAGGCVACGPERRDHPRATTGDAARPKCLISVWGENCCDGWEMEGDGDWWGPTYAALIRVAEVFDGGIYTNDGDCCYDAEGGCTDLWGALGLMVGLLLSQGVEVSVCRVDCCECTQQDGPPCGKCDDHGVPVVGPMRRPWPSLTSDVLGGDRG